MEDILAGTKRKNPFISEPNEPKREKNISKSSTSSSVVAGPPLKLKKTGETSVLLPSTCTCQLWIEEEDEMRLKLMEPTGGRWLMFYPISELDSKWESAKKLFQENKLDNIVTMKVSTAMPNPKSTNPKEGVIAMYVGRVVIVDDDLSDEEVITSQGKQLVKLFGYQSKQGKMYYKLEAGNLDKQNGAFEGKKKNYTMTVNCGRITEDKNIS